MILYMGRILFVEPEKYPELEVQLQEEGIDYDRASAEEAEELFARIDYDGVVGPEDRDFYEAIDEDVPYLAFEHFDRNFTDTLSGVPDIDSERIEHYIDRDPKMDAETYVDMLAHDIRNDINALDGYLELVRTAGSSDNVEDYWQVIDDKIDSINDLVETTDAISSLGGDQKRTVDLSSSLEQAAEEYRSEAESRGFDLRLNSHESYPVEAGPLLGDMYGQILENALNHSGGDVIEVDVTSNERVAKVNIEDNGKGIPEDLHGAIMEEGFTNGESGNTGIGLFLVSQIAESYDISLDIGNSDDLGGARFTTFVPGSKES